jgi:PleD family two-component response regulator
VDIYQQRWPDVVLLEALMPKMDGYSTCTELIMILGAEHLPILMMTGLKKERFQILRYCYERGGLCALNGRKSATPSA